MELGFEPKADLTPELLFAIDLNIVSYGTEEGSS